MENASLNKPPCPYCGVPFTRVPRARAKCQSCGQTVYVGVDSDAVTPIVLTAADARAVRWLKDYRVSPADRSQHEAILRVRFGRPPTASDVVWHVMNERLSRAYCWSEIAAVQSHMALFLSEEGRDATNCLRAAADATLRNLNSIHGPLPRTTEPPFVIIRAAAGACPACSAANGLRLSIDEALARHPIPVPGCTTVWHKGNTHGFCRCTYDPADPA
jgi:hypothetical protein